MPAILFYTIVNFFDTLLFYVSRTCRISSSSRQEQLVSCLYLARFQSQCQARTMYRVYLQPSAKNWPASPQTNAVFQLRTSCDMAPLSAFRSTAHILLCFVLQVSCDLVCCPIAKHRSLSLGSMVIGPFGYAWHYQWAIYYGYKMHDTEARRLLALVELHLPGLRTIRLRSLRARSLPGSPTFLDKNAVLVGRNVKL